MERILAEETDRHFGTRIARVGHLGAYVRRGVAGRLWRRSGGISEHFFDDALDVMHLDLDSGPCTITTTTASRPRAMAAESHGGLLRDVFRRVRREPDLPSAPIRREPSLTLSFRRSRW